VTRPSEPAVAYHRHGAVGVVTMNRPDTHNRMTEELLTGFSAAVVEARADGEARAIIITGSGAAFSAGADFTASVQRGPRTGLPQDRSFAMYEPFLSVLELEVPVVAAMNGHAVGGGFGLALLCDVRVASLTAKYGANFCRLGLAPGLGISYLLPRLIGISRAAELLFSGRLVTGEEAAEIGLVSQAVPGEAVLERAQELAAAFAASAPLAVRATKRALYDGLAWDVPRAARREAAAQAATLATADFEEGVAALLEKRPPSFRGN
jgi:enoyl-CoA hydratase/carnithine racemase